MKLNEKQLRKIIKESIVHTLNYRQNLFESILNEGMVMPRIAKKIWWDNDELFIVLGNDNRWYTVYPNWGDSFMEDSKVDKVIQSYADAIMNAYLKNGIKRPSVHTYNLDTKPQIIDETNEPQFFDKINSWLSKKGFSLKESPSEHNWGIAIWEYNGEYGNDAQNDEMLSKISNMQDVTQQVGQFFNSGNSPKDSSRQALKYLQQK